MAASLPETYGPLAVGERSAGTSIAVDMDSDGDLDLVIWQQPRLTILQNDGDGGFSPWHQARIAGKPGMLAAGDFDGDGFQDIAALGTIGQRDVLHLYQNDRSGDLVKRSRQRTDGYWVTFIDAQLPSVEDQIVLLGWASGIRELSLNRVNAGRIERVRPLVVSLGGITPPAKIDFDGDGRDDGLIVAVNQFGTSSLLEVRLPPVYGEPARSIFSTSEFTIQSVVARADSTANASGPDLVLTTLDTTGAVRRHVMTMDLPSGPGMAYADPVSIFETQYRGGYSYPSEETFEIQSLADVNDDGEVDVVLYHAYRLYTSDGRYGPILFERQSSLLVLSRGADQQWDAMARDVSSRFIRRSYWTEDLNGDGLTDLVRMRGGRSNQALVIEAAFNVPLD